MHVHVHVHGTVCVLALHSLCSICTVHYTVKITTHKIRLGKTSTVWLKQSHHKKLLLCEVHTYTCAMHCLHHVDIAACQYDDVVHFVGIHSMDQ